MEQMKQLLAAPKIEEIESALFIQPHPDDNEIGAGGLIAYLRKKGVPVYAVTVTKGDGGSDEYEPEELSRIRHQEALDAAKILDVEYLGNLGFDNSHPGTVSEICEALVKVIRSCQPHAIFSVDPDLPNECHPVHIRVGEAVKEAFMRSGQKYYPFADEEQNNDAFTPSILGQYFTEDETEVLDISEYYDLKIAAIKAHKSQINKEYLLMLMQYYDLIASDTEYEHVERIKLFSQLQSHCFALPKAIRDTL